MLKLLTVANQAAKTCDLAHSLELTQQRGEEKTEAEMGNAANRRLRSKQKQAKNRLLRAFSGVSLGRAMLFISNNFPYVLLPSYRR
jgi:hypothetical protein